MKLYSFINGNDIEAAHWHDKHHGRQAYLQITIPEAQNDLVSSPALSCAALPLTPLQDDIVLVMVYHRSKISEEYQAGAAGAAAGGAVAAS